MPTDEDRDKLIEQANPFTRWERNFIQQMRRLREKQGMTQTELARIVRTLSMDTLLFHQQTVQRIESGERPVRLNEANVIAQAVGSSVETMTAQGTTSALELRHAVDRMRRGASGVAHNVNEDFGSWLSDVEEFAASLSGRLPDKEDPTWKDLDPVALWGMAWASAIVKATDNLEAAWLAFAKLSGETVPESDDDDGWRAMFYRGEVLDAMEQWRKTYLGVPASRIDDDVLRVLRADVTRLYALFPETDERELASQKDAD